MKALTVIGAASLALCLAGPVPTVLLSSQPSGQDASPGHSPAQLTQSDVLALAKTAARKVVRQKIHDYTIKSVIFDSYAKEWSILFEQPLSHSTGPGCLLVYVQDDTKDSKVQPC